jgi:GntR family transcriptional regulator
MAPYRLELGPIPLHHQVYLDLKSRIATGEWRPGDRLPAERELALKYGCSLITVRHALGELAREQRIERTRGRGTFVLKPRIDRDFAGGLSFAEEMERQGLVPETRLVASQIEPATEPVAHALGRDLGTPVVALERLRLGNGEPLLLERASLPADRFADLLTMDVERESLYDLLAKRFGTRVDHAREAIEPVLLASREARLLEVPRRTPALLVEGTAYAADDTPIEFARSYVRSDRTRYYLDRSVTRASWIRTLGPALPTAVGERR